MCTESPMALQIGQAAAFSHDPLESAIESTVRMIIDCANEAVSVEGVSSACGKIAGRLAEHLDALLDMQKLKLMRE